MARIVVLISGRGSNLHAIQQAICRGELAAEIALVVSDNPNSPGIVWAASQGLTTAIITPSRTAKGSWDDRALIATLKPINPDWVVLAGYMRILSTDFVGQFVGRVINIHPSLLPLFKGLKPHAQALAAGVRWHGCTVHFVNQEIDSGAIIAQAIVPVKHNDTVDSLADRVIVQEHRIYPRVLQWLVTNKVAWQTEQCFWPEGYEVADSAACCPHV